MTATTSSFADALAGLLDYPDPSLPAQLAACRDAASAIDRASAAHLDRFAREIDGRPLDALRELYVETFDLNARCTLDVGWHLYGEAYERGALLAALRADLERAAVPERDELPDYLPSLLRLIGRADAARARELRQVIAPAVKAIEAALDARRSPYAHVMKTVAAFAAAGG